MTNCHRRRAEVTVNHPPITDSHSNAAEQERRETGLDETIEQSFPASDPPSSNPNPDTHDAALPHDVEALAESAFLLTIAWPRQGEERTS